MTVPKMSHISSVVNESRAKIASSGTAFARRLSDEASWPASRANTQRRIESSPKTKIA